MLSKEQLEEIKGFLEQSQNSLFFFDNDVDGLCSFLILQRAIGRGKGVPARSFPELDISYVRKVEELGPDAVFILDKPRVSEEFIDAVLEKGIPIVWVDHHGVGVEERIKEKVHYYNSFPSAEPTTYLCYKCAGKKEDMWLAMIGCIGDVYKPDFASVFANEYPELFNQNLEAFDSLFTTEIGKAVKILNFGLKDRTTNVISLIKYLMKAKSIHDILEENKNTKQLHYRYNELNKVLEKMLTKAEQDPDINTSKLLFFSYGGETSMSSEISNAVFFRNKKKLVVIAYKKQDKVNISIRGKNAKKITLEIVSKIESANGGGHEEATGIQIPADKFDEFKGMLEEMVS